MKNGGVWRRLAGSLLETRQIYLCGAVRLGKGIKKCGEDLIFRSGVQEIVWTKPIGEDVDEALSSLLYGLIREESSIFYHTDEIRLNKGRIFLKTGEAQKTFLLTSIAYLLEEMRKYDLRLPDALEI